MKHVRRILSVILSVTLFLQFSLACFADVKNEMIAVSSRSSVDDCGFFNTEITRSYAVSVPPMSVTPDALLGEDTARCEASSKIYLLDSGHEIAASYANRVHKKAADGSLSSVSYGNGDEILYTYDALGRVETETRGTDVYRCRYNARGYLGTLLKNSVICEEYFYDLSDRLISVKNGAMVVNFVYDGEGRLADTEYYYSQNSPDPYRYTTTYGSDDRVEGVSLEGRAEVSYTYDASGNISSICFSDGSQADYYCDDGGNLLSKQLLLCGEEDREVV